MMAKNSRPISSDAAAIRAYLKLVSASISIGRILWCGVISLVIVPPKNIQQSSRRHSRSHETAHAMYKIMCHADHANSVHGQIVKTAKTMQSVSDF